uniref:Uncharacterized protein n=1 Tax=Candidatus Kentrum sp. LFY TaxID=2126342 RepID=A0A450WGE6_9GAMM|nr:MAG: hypothetical protein BECKLFY1418C_GA0070996_102125 [Candidatus Kentron sp. LFY]
MSEEYNGISGQGQDRQEKDSIFDFLYHDVDRINSFLSQFNDVGYLQGSTEQKSFSSGNSSDTTNHIKADAAVL